MRGGEVLSEGAVQGIQPDILDRQGVLVGDVELAAACGLPDVDPVGRFVAGAAEAIGLDEGFKQDGLVAVTVLPIGGQTAGDVAEDLGSKPFGAHPGQDQEALCSAKI